ncbi:hypothetical protein CDCA_CDCA01G0430 [Cyanidium caldarium]|uniref:protein-ribulosamine 3-kinase n=1 Tax=Cyanidium caldarium TaxID=2771 RepID=A0AAV9IQQ2_CYACA|nr:hypothetical protein CDCA_CDCA01G0430 [Cyanidium caldarium]
MPADALSDAICKSISEAIGKPFRGRVRGGGLGGSWSSASLLRSDDGGEGEDFFVKLGAPEAVSMFSAEFEGLREMQQTQSVRVPAPVCYGIAERRSFIVMESLNLGAGGADSYRQLGEQLAAMHRHSSDGRGYGWHRGNTIGATPQINTWTEDWPTFFVEHRLRYQFRLADRRGHPFHDHEVVLQRVKEVLAEHCTHHQVMPSLVHGDLWGGNVAVLSDSGEPVIYDPATYYGDREVDLAMSELFGRLPGPFYSAYHAVWPIPPGYQEARREIYNLYHILNHGALFGEGYYQQAESMVRSIMRYAG